MSTNDTMEPGRADHRSDSFENILFSIEDGVATITLNRPDKMNAYSFALGAELASAYARCDADDSVRAVVITGAGKAFCAGADMSRGDETFSGGRSRSSVERKPARKGLHAFQVRKPVVAAINGHAVGIGLTLALQCDLRIVASDAKLALPFVRRGITPELASSSILPRLIGFARAADLMLSGRTIRGDEAAALGLASEAVAAGDVLPRAREWARDVAVNAAPVAVALTKQLLWEGATEQPQETMAKENRLLAWIGKQPDAIEGVRSFLERRTPEWKLNVSTDIDYPPMPTDRKT